MKYKELEAVAIILHYTIKKIGANTVIEYESLRYSRINRIVIDETQEDEIIIDVLASHPSDFEILTSALAYAETPLDERQEEKKYYLRHRYLKSGVDSYLSRDHIGLTLWLKNRTTTQSIQTQFTQVEIDEIKEKYKTTLDDFEIIEVKE